MITRETTVSGSSVLAKFYSLLFVLHMLPTSKSFSLLSSLYINTISKNDINKTINADEPWKQENVQLSATKKIPNSRMSNLFVSLHQLHSKAPSSWASVMLWETSARNQTEMFSCRTFLWWRASSCQGTLTFALQSFQRMTNAHAQGFPPHISRMFSMHVRFTLKCQGV